MFRTSFQILQTFVPALPLLVDLAAHRTGAVSPDKHNRTSNHRQVNYILSASPSILIVIQPPNQRYFKFPSANQSFFFMVGGMIHHLRGALASGASVASVASMVLVDFRANLGKTRPSCALDGIEMLLREKETSRTSRITLNNFNRFPSNLLLNLFHFISFSFVLLFGWEWKLLWAYLLFCDRCCRHCGCPPPTLCLLVLHRPASSSSSTRSSSDCRCASPLSLEANPPPCMFLFSTN